MAKKRKGIIKGNPPDSLLNSYENVFAFNTLRYAEELWKESETAIRRDGLIYEPPHYFTFLRGLYYAIKDSIKPAKNFGEIFIKRQTGFLVYRYGENNSNILNIIYSPISLVSDAMGILKGNKEVTSNVFIHRRVGTLRESTYNQPERFIDLWRRFWRKSIDLIVTNNEEKKIVFKRLP